MNKFELTLPSKKGNPVTHPYSGPSGWGELSHAQYMGLCRVLLLIQQHPELRLALPGILYGLKPRHADFLFNAEALKAAGYPAHIRADLLSHGQNLLATTDWVRTTLPQTWPYKLMPEQYVGPGDGLKDLSFGEFIACEQAYARFYQGDTTQLAKLVSVLINIPLRSEHGTQRRIENDYILNKRPDWVGTWSKAELYAYLHAYEGNRAELASHFRNVFPKVDAAEETDGTPQPTWYQLALDMAEGKVETFEINARANVYLVLSLLDRQIAQQPD